MNKELKINRIKKDINSIIGKNTNKKSIIFLKRQKYSNDQSKNEINSINEKTPITNKTNQNTLNYSSKKRINLEHSYTNSYSKIDYNKNIKINKEQDNELKFINNTYNSEHIIKNNNKGIIKFKNIYIQNKNNINNNIRINIYPINKRNKNRVLNYINSKSQKQKKNNSQNISYYNTNGNNYRIKEVKKPMNKTIDIYKTQNYNINLSLDATEENLKPEQILEIKIMELNNKYNINNKFDSINKNKNEYNLIKLPKKKQPIKLITGPNIKIEDNKYKPSNTSINHYITNIRKTKINSSQKKLIYFLIIQLI